MTTSTQDHVRALFADARQMQVQALQQLNEGDIRDAAEKAWCATKRATDALVLSRTGEEPPSTHDTTEALLSLARHSDAYETLGRSLLHQDQLPTRHLLLHWTLRTRYRTPHTRNRPIHRRRSRPRCRVSAVDAPDESPAPGALTPQAVQSLSIKAIQLPGDRINRQQRPLRFAKAQHPNMGRGKLRTRRTRLRPQTLRTATGQPHPRLLPDGLLPQREMDCANDDSVMWELEEYITDPSIIWKLEEQNRAGGQARES